MTGEDAILHDLAQHAGPQPPRIFTVGIDGNDVRQVTRDGNNQFPAWSNGPGAQAK